MLLKSICITWPCDEEIVLFDIVIQSTTSSNHLCKQSPHVSTACQTSISPFIYHILLSLADLSLIYSCRLHSQSIRHVTRSINLHTSCISHDWKFYLPTTQLINLYVRYVLCDRGTFLPATQLIHSHTSCMLCDEALCVPTGHWID